MSSGSAKRRSDCPSPGASKRSRLKDCIRSRLVTFIVGTNSEAYKIHENVVTRISKPIAAMLKGNMKDAIEGRVVWNDVEHSVFDDLLEFAYTSTFSPVAEDRNSTEDNINIVKGKEARVFIKDLYEAIYNFTYESDDEMLLPPCNMVQNVVWTKVVRNTENLLAEEHLSERFIDSMSDFPPGKRGSWNEPEMKARFRNTADVLRITKLYILADRYAIDALQQLCIIEMIKALGMLQYDDLPEALLAVVSLIWPNTKVEDRIQWVVLEFINASMPAILAHDELDTIRSLLTNFPSFSASLVLNLPRNLWLIASKHAVY